MNRGDREGGRLKEANDPGGVGGRCVESARKGSVKSVGRLERKGGMRRFPKMGHPRGKDFAG